MSDKGTANPSITRILVWGGFAIFTISFWAIIIYGIKMFMY